MAGTQVSWEVWATAVVQATESTNVDFRGQFPLGDQFSLFGKLGTAFMSSSYGTLFSTSMMGLHYAAGAAYNFSTHIRGGLSINYINANTSKGNYNNTYALANVDYLF